MKNENHNHSRINDMLFLLVENTLNDEGVKYIESWLSSGSQAKREYCSFINDYVAMKHQVNSIIDMDDEEFAIYDDFDVELWSALAETEKVAEAIKTQSIEKKLPVTIKPRKLQPPERKISKLSLVALFTSMAAVILLIAFLALHPAPEQSIGTIKDSMNVVWAEPAISAIRENRIWSNSGPQYLLGGIVKIEFDYGAEVILEGPAEIQFISPDLMKMSHGRSFAYVPKHATGFTIETPYSSIIDLGTEFGVKVNVDGSTDVHLYQGKASLIPGMKGQAKPSHLLVAGQAKSVNTQGKVTDIILEKTTFVRNVSSKDNWIWRGENVNLADIVGGGNGFGNGILPQRIDLNTGRPAGLEPRYAGTSARDNAYHPAVNNLFVDGVFVPDGEFQPVEISSTGLVFKDCPNTCSLSYYDALNGSFKDILNYEQGLVLNNIEYGTLEKPCISLHANAGITFDLLRIRQSLNGLQIKKFISLAGISQTCSYKELAKADFWILVDGQLVLHKQQMLAGQAFTVDIDLDPTARFLTLITTDGGPVAEALKEQYTGIGEISDEKADWCFFADPYLILESF